MSSGNGVSAQLAEKLCNVRFSDFPASTVHKAKLHILDTLGAALAGSASAETQIAWQALGLQMDRGRYSNRFKSFFHNRGQNTGLYL